MFKNLIINKVLNSIKEDHYIIVQELDLLVLNKWLNRISSLIKPIATYTKYGTVIVIQLKNDKSISLISYKKELDEVRIKNNKVFIDSELPNPFSYKVI